MPQSTLQLSYQYCQEQVQRHYENFPVASSLLPKRLRRPISVIYAFARSADDIADEGDHPPDVRLQQLEAYGAKLDSICEGHTTDDLIFAALTDVINRYDLPIDLFHDLLTAFRMDVTVRRYANFHTIMDYCRYSANPVGRLLLHLYGATTQQNMNYANAICSALQLINFLQDITQDYDENNRIYLPQDEMVRFGISDTHIHERKNSPAMRQLVDMQIKRAYELLLHGAPLVRILKGRMGFELRMIIWGGVRILQKLYKNREDVYARPRLSIGDWLWVFWQALRGKYAFAKAGTYFVSNEKKNIFPIRAAASFFKFCLTQKKSFILGSEMAILRKYPDK